MTPKPLVELIWNDPIRNTLEFIMQYPTLLVGVFLAASSLLSVQFLKIVLFSFVLFWGGGISLHYIDSIGKVVLPSFVSTSNHIGYTFRDCKEGIGLMPVA